MSFLTTTLAKAAFKKSLGKAHTSNEKDLANEALPSSFTLSSRDIFADDIPKLPSVAVSEGIAIECKGVYPLELVIDATSNGKSYFVVVPDDPAHPLRAITNPLTSLNYATGDRVTRIIPQFYGDRYRPVLKKSGVEIPPLASENWFLDSFAGVLNSEMDLNLGSVGTIECYVYTGPMLNNTINDMVLGGGNPGDLAVYQGDRQVGPEHNVTYTSSTLSLRNNTALTFLPSSSSLGVSVHVSTALSQNVAFVLPTSDGESGSVLKTDGSGQLYFGSINIGPAEDGTYTDGLFTDINPDTNIGTVVDRFNEILKALAPPPASSLSAITFSNPAGASGKVSFGATNTIAGYANVGADAGQSILDINGTFSPTGQRRGIYTRQTISGVVAGGVAAHSYSYPANAFGDADQGTLQLETNGSVVHSVNLATFTSGSSLAASGSGFNLSAATPVKFQDGTFLDLFKYRTGTWTISGTSQRAGWNYTRVKHIIGSTVRTTNYFEWVLDDETTATSFTGASLTNLTLSGSRYLSGVRYFTSGSAQYNITIQNAYRNTYSVSSAAITHTGTNCTLTAQPMPNMSLESDTVQIVNKMATISPASNNRMLGVDLSASTTVLRSVQGTVTSGVATGGWRILLDANNTTATDLYEDFRGEGYRQQSSLSLSSLSYGAGPNNGPANWDSTQALTDGLLIYAGALRYPKTGLNSGNFKRVDEGSTFGPTNPGAYAGNPDYSTATGEKTYLRYFYTTTPRQNFILNVTSSSTNFVASSNRGSLTSNNLTVEILAPGITLDGSGNVMWKDCVTPYTTDAAVGAYAATFGNTIPTNWGLTLGTKSTANSGFAIVLRITAPASWTGNISALTLTLL